MAPRNQSKKRVRGDATFKPHGDQPSTTSTVESVELSPERQQVPKRKIGDATYRPGRHNNPSTSSVEEQQGKRSPGRPRKSPKATTASRPTRQPRATSEETERLFERGAPITFRTPGVATAFSSDRPPKLSITDRLKNIRDFLRVEDSTTHPRFRERLDEFDAFLADLVGVKEMFDADVYHAVRSMLVVARDRMVDHEREEALRVYTYKVPSWSTTETESSKSSGRDRIFSPDNTRDKSEETDTTSHHSQEWKGDDAPRTLNDYGDGDCLEWAHDSPTQTRQGIRTSTGKRPFEELVDAGYMGKRAKFMDGGSNVLSPSAINHPWSLGERQFQPYGERVPNKIVTENVEEQEEEEGTERRSGVKETERRPRLGSGSLMPPEIAGFEEDDSEPVARAVEEPRKEEISKPDEQFWPGDPVFMFGETTYLQALQSRQIEKDLAPKDEEAQAAIDRRPLMRMFARFQLPKVTEQVIERKPSQKSSNFCTVS
ncbi:MAG: hypothetical protein LQ346_002929 [Caloplaca aetnensis]|nr:MAG: hypothetical protein LQ346_002929 [Caloplaca aetnensis]